MRCPQFPSSQGTPVCVHLGGEFKRPLSEEMCLCDLVWSFLLFSPLVIVLLFLEENKKVIQNFAT